VRKPPGSIVYTQMLNQRGGIECDLTVSRIDEQSFYIVTGTGYATHDAHWIQSQFQDGQDVQLQDVTGEKAVIGLMGPESRNLLSAITSSDLSNKAFPYMTWQEVTIAGATVRAMRLTFVGELGWELHIPTQNAEVIYDAILAAGQQCNILHAGYRAIDSLRLEKGYRIWGKDISPDYTPLEAGLGFAVKLKTDIDFLGRQALEAQIGQLHKRLVCFTVEDASVVLLGRETIYRNGERVGWISSGGFGYTINKPIGYGYVRSTEVVTEEFLQAGRYELEIAGEMIECELHMQSLYDPSMTRVRM
jgi:4-methylaminobutanoate oxidase (formaldehyde-forming)